MGKHPCQGAPLSPEAPVPPLHDVLASAKLRIPPTGPVALIVRRSPNTPNRARDRGPAGIRHTEWLEWNIGHGETSSDIYFCHNL